MTSSSEKDPLQWKRFLEWARLLDAPGFNPAKDDVTESLVRDLHAKGKTLAVWTVNGPADMARLMRWGVDALITDKPDLALDTTRGLVK